MKKSTAPLKRQVTLSSAALAALATAGYARAAIVSGWDFQNYAIATTDVAPVSDLGAVNGNAFSLGFTNSYNNTTSVALCDIAKATVTTIGTDPSNPKQRMAAPRAKSRQRLVAGCGHRIAGRAVQRLDRRVYQRHRQLRHRVVQRFGNFEVPRAIHDRRHHLAQRPCAHLRGRSDPDSYQQYQRRRKHKHGQRHFHPVEHPDQPVVCRHHRRSDRNRRGEQQQ